MTDRELIDAIDSSGRGLTPWEIGFIEEMLRKLKNSAYELSGPERDKADEIFEDRVTDEDDD